VSPRDALGVLDPVGMAAYFGVLDVGRVCEGDTVVVSGAAGAVGSIAGQIARIKGARRVVGVCGSPAECSWVVGELGFDAAIDCRADPVAARVADNCPDGVDLVFDDVGGWILDACLGELALCGRVVLCGPMARYNDGTRAPGPSNYLTLLLRRGRMEGFQARDYAGRFAEARADMASWISDGRLKHVERVIDGLEHAPEALDMLVTGATDGKLVVRV
jgi:NADPH-dependent curcumin reductase CurA